MRWLWLGFALIIAYGSLYPFDFHAHELDAVEVQRFLASCCRATGRGDILGNVVLFVPFGYLGAVAVRPGASFLTRTLLVLGLGTCFALALQVAQFYLPSRNANLQDTGWNAIGTLAGALLCGVTHRSVLDSAGRIDSRTVVPSLLIACWLTYRLVPFVPSIDFELIKDSLKPIFLNPQIDPISVFHDAVAWLVVASLLQAMRDSRRLDSYLPAVMIGSFALEVLIVSNSIHPGNLTGALLAILIWWGGLRAAAGRTAILSALLGAVLIVSGVEPFTVRPQPSDFNWLPFHGLLGGSMYVNVLAISEKAFLYGSLVYLLWSTRLGRAAGTALAVSLVAAVEAAQIFFYRHTPEITDPLLVILAALGLAAMQRREQSPNNTAQGQGDSLGARVDGAELMHTASPEVIAITVNFRRGTVVFLDRLSQEFGLDTSAACRLIIDLMTGEPCRAAVGREDLVALRDRHFAHASTSESGTFRQWEQRTIELSQTEFQIVRSRAERKGLSLSRAIRHIIVEFIEGPLGIEVDTGSHAPVSGSAWSRRSAPSRESHREAARSTSAIRRSSALRRRWQFAVVFLAVVAVSIVFALGSTSFERAPSIVASVSWAGNDANIVFDHHNHTEFSDGKLSVEELVAKARESGCDALAVTDHSDKGGSASNRQRQVLRRLRAEMPDFLLFGGVEINMPSYQHREHANVIVDPTVEDRILPRLRDAAERGVDEALADGDGISLDEEFMIQVASFLERGDSLVMIYNHPSRKDRDPNENYSDIIRWNAVGQEPAFVAFAGAPGHQNAAELGDYEPPMFTIDRWDPVVAEVGGTWDRLLSEGMQVWGALAGSDYHNSRRDKAPCAFARTHVAAESFSYSAVLKALRAGTFWADHGKILSKLEFIARVDGLATTVHPGSVVSLGGGEHPVVAHVGFQRGPGSAGLPLKVEFIGNCRTGDTETFAVEEVSPNLSDVALSLVPLSSGADGNSCFLRVRVRLEIPDEPDLLAYTNPIRFLLN